MQTQFDKWRAVISDFTEKESFRKIFFQLKSKADGIEPFTLKMAKTPMKSKKKQTQKTLILITKGDESGGHHMLQTAEAGESFYTFDSLEGQGLYSEALVTGAESIQTDMLAGDLLCHQYSLTEALHFIDPARYPSKPEWEKGPYFRWYHLYNDYRQTQNNKNKKALKSAASARDTQKKHNFDIILKTMKKLIKDPCFEPAFKKTFKEEVKGESWKVWLADVKEVVKNTKAKDVLEFE